MAARRIGCSCGDQVAGEVLMSDGDAPRFTVVGGGLAGALMACYLGRAGHEVDVYERRPDLRRGDIPAGKSINLAISVRGIAALDEVGLARQVLDMAIPMRGRMIHAPSGALTFQPYSKDPSDAINSVSRGGLNAVLLDAAERYPTVRLHFAHKCVDIDLDAPAATFQRDGSADPITVRADVIIGADGAFSAVRARMQRLDRFDYRQDYLQHGYKELTIPPGPGGTHIMEKHALHIWPRRSYMMIALPNIDGSYTCTLFWPFEGPTSFAALSRDHDVLAFFRTHFPDAVEIMPALVEDYRRNPVSSLVTVRSGPWCYRDKVVLVGDACHAVVPFYGQGMNAAFGDCKVLNHALTRHPSDRARALRDYYTRRKVHVDTLADLAIANFLEMRDRTGSRRFRIAKKTEQLLHRLLGRSYIPLYNMVSFSQIPYADALARARRQLWVVRAVAGALVVLLTLAVIWWMRA